MKCKKGLDIFLALHLPRHWQYLQLTMIWLICYLISDATILKQFSFLLDFLWIIHNFPEKACFLTVLCINVTALSSLDLKYTVQNPLWKRHVCPEWINAIMENNLSHKSGANNMLYKVSTKVFPLSSNICIRTEPFFFSGDVMSVRNFNEFICIL